MIPSSPSFQPLYLQIKSLLERGLESGEWAPAEAIPRITAVSGGRRSGR